MDAIAFLLGIVMIVGTAGYIGFIALTLHHDRFLRQLRRQEYNDQAKFQLMEKAIEKGLPPGRYLDN